MIYRIQLRNKKLYYVRRKIARRKPNPLFQSIMNRRFKELDTLFYKMTGIQLNTKYDINISISEKSRDEMKRIREEFIQMMNQLELYSSHCSPKDCK